MTAGPGRPRRTARVKRDCRCPKASHEHGTYLAYLSDKCRCTPCTDANSRYKRARDRQIAYGRWEPELVDAGPTREHVAMLRAAGMGPRTIASNAGVTFGVVNRILYRDRDQPPSRRVRASTEKAILAVRPSHELLAPGALVDGPGMRRRLRALVAIGYTQRRLGKEMGCTSQHVAHLLHGAGRVTVASTRRVVDLYDRLWDKPPAPGSSFEAAGIGNAKATAVRHGWVVPLAWDDDTIDDPEAAPDTGEPDVVVPCGTSKWSTAEAVETLLEDDPLLTSRQVADRLGKKPNTLSKALERAGRQDLLGRLAENRRARAA